MPPYRAALEGANESRRILHRAVTPGDAGHEFQREAKQQRHCYHEVQLKTKTPGSSACLVFAYGLGRRLHVEYGEVRIEGRRVRAIPLFTGETNETELDADGWVRVWTWFSSEECRFFVRSDVDFDLRSLPSSASQRDPRQRPPGVVVFFAAQHHLRNGRGA